MPRDGQDILSCFCFCSSSSSFLPPSRHFQYFDREALDLSINSFVISNFRWAPLWTRKSLIILIDSNVSSAILVLCFSSKFLLTENPRSEPYLEDICTLDDYPHRPYIWCFSDNIQHQLQVAGLMLLTAWIDRLNRNRHKRLPSMTDAKQFLLAISGLWANTLQE